MMEHSFELAPSLSQNIRNLERHTNSFCHKYMLQRELCQHKPGTSEIWQGDGRASSYIINEFCDLLPIFFQAQK